MKILHIASALPKISGGSTFCMELCERLMSLGHEVTIAIKDPNDPNIYPSCSHVPIVSIGAVLNSETGCSFDVAHIHGLWHPILHKAGIWAYKRGIPVVWSPHGMLAPWAINHKWWKKCLPWYLYQRQDLLRVALFHATSELEGQWIKERGFNQPCCVVPLGTHLPDTNDKPGGDSSTRCLTRENIIRKRNALFVGRIYPVKNLGALIKAFAETKRNGSGTDWRLLLAGPDQAGYKAELVKIATSLQLNVGDLTGNPAGDLEFVHGNTDSDILFTGPVFGDQKDDLYRCADLFVLPSHTENFAGVVVDALAFGVPVMVSDKTPWTEVEEMDCGKICPTDVDGITSVLTKLLLLRDEERTDMGRKGRLLVEHKYTWAVVAEQMVDAYLKMLGGVAGSVDVVKQIS